MPRQQFRFTLSLQWRDRGPFHLDAGTDHACGRVRPVAFGTALSPAFAVPFERFAAAVPNADFTSANTTVGGAPKSLEKRGENPLFPTS
jgi:hypothetical protein